VDGRPMGSVLDAAAAPARHVPRVEVFVEGTDELEHVELFAGEAVAYRGRPDGRSCRFTWRPEEPPPDGTYYQLRVRQADGEMAWSTPVWIRPGPPQRAPDAVFARRELAVILAYASVLNGWADLANPALGGRSPREALTDPFLTDELRRLWPRLVDTAAELQARVDELGLETDAQAAAIVKAYRARLPKGIDEAPTVHPLVDVEKLAAELGM